MTKISRIEISDFRVYENKQVFSFHHNGQLANLVVLYAPNGYGKTSFFDAVEWAFSGKIGRFEHDQIHQEITRREFADGDQILLTNRKSFAKGREGQIDVVTADGKTLKRRVDSRKVHGKSRKYDYRQGVLSGDFKASQVAKLGNSNVLTQDQIDSFLKSSTPEEKFNALSEFWPEGEAATRIYKQLSGYIRVIDNDLKASHSRLGDIKKVIKALLNTDQHLQTINSSITALIKDSVLGFQADAITHPVNEAVYQSLRDAALSFLKKGENQLEIHIRSRSSFQDLIARLPSYEQALAYIAKLRSEQKQLEGLEKLYLDQGAAVKAATERSETLTARNNRLAELAQLIEVIDTYLAAVKELAEQETLRTQLLEQNQSELEKLDTFRDSHQALLIIHRDQQAAIENLDGQTSATLEKNDQFTYWRKELETDQQKLRLIDQELADKEKQINRLTERRRHLSSALENGAYAELTEIDRNEFTSLLSPYQALEKPLEQALNELLQARSDYQRSGSLNENLDKILSWGEEYVQTLDADHCPLCKTEFSSVQELLDKIRADKAPVLKVNQQQQALEKLTDTYEELSKQRNEAKSKLDDALRAALGRVITSIEAQYTEKDLLTGQQKDLQQSIRYAGDLAQSLYNELRPYLAETPTDTLVPPSLKERLEKQLADLRTAAAKQFNLVEKKRELLEACENSISANRNRITGLDNAIQLLRAATTLSTGTQLIQSLNIAGSQPSKAGLLQLQKEWQEAADSTRRELETQRTRLNSIRGELDRHTLKVREEEVAGRKFQLVTAIKALDDTINAYTGLYFDNVIADAIERQTLQEALAHTLQQITIVEAENQRLRDFAIQIELINENISKGKLETEQAQLTAKVPQLEAAKTKLTAARATAAEYIDREINNYFNKDVINQIYSRIEPHPELNRIDFTPQIGDHGPSLDVHAVGASDHLNPVLFLSAGQLNVLSLSIFLAKVFETGSEVISTIFMDDPVQNLSDINILSFLDLIRSMVTTYDKQLVISSHDEHFFKLIQHKLPADDFNAAYIELADFGQLKAAAETTN